MSLQILLEPLNCLMKRFFADSKNVADVNHGCIKFCVAEIGDVKKIQVNEQFPEKRWK